MTADAYILRCGTCGTRNRVQTDRLASGPKCGKCGAALRVDELNRNQPLVVTDQTFDAEVLHAPLPVLLDCWAAWCGPCKMIAPILDQLAAEWQGRVRIAKLNVDENPRTASAFGVRSIPTLLIFERGKLVDTLVGAVPKQQIVQKMARFLA